MNDRPDLQAMRNSSDLHPFVLEATGISKAFVQGGLNVQVLNNTQLSVRRGEKLAIVGASGSGKSTLLHVLGGLDHSDAGSVAIGDVNLTSMSDAERVAFRNRLSMLNQAMVTAYLRVTTGPNVSSMALSVSSVSVPVRSSSSVALQISIYSGAIPETGLSLVVA